jgi:2-oxo-4-hydroxy-4-carboxy-5-ureidoimidazoline decarboxylase
VSAGQSIAELDTATPAVFAEAVAPLFEGAPRFLARLAAARPFGSWERLFEVARAEAHSMPEAEQLELVDAHPRLGAPPASVSRLSFGEQGFDRDAAATIAADAGRERDRLATELERLNRAYETRFGFRYCVFVAGRPLPELLRDMAAALGREREAELHRALDAVVHIAIDRHRKLAGEPPRA